ncbi:MAG: hypothetical protein EXS05_18275 [Planctomycetaceae bacterium]|nr:hypothetical protein [Planctomycetaceae bacterium]
MSDIYASLAFGIGLVFVGGYLIRWQAVMWRSHRTDPGLEEREMRHFRRQYFRRMLVSALLILLGIMIPAGDAVMTWLGNNVPAADDQILQKRYQAMFAGYWIIVLLITLWIVLLAAVDWLSTRVFVRKTRVALSTLARQRRELEAEVDRLRGRHRNGSS